MSIRVDYDAIAHLYDEPRRDHQPDARLEAFATERGDSRLRVLDVGCGTGKQLAANRRHFEHMTFAGVDRSSGMLRIAHARGDGVYWIHGDAEALPLATHTFDYATNQFSYPHIGDKRRFVAEMFRVLRPGGRFVLTNIDPWAMPDWIIYRFFPEARALDDRDYLTRDALRELFARAGFTAIDVSTRDLSRDEDLSAFESYSSSRHQASQFMAIPDAAYEAGFRRVREACVRSGPGAVVRSTFVVITIQADKPPF
jgi:ubiquinone/menaquinone biosynthesis C-methylase UbiE